MKLSKNDLKKLVQESVIKLMKEKNSNFKRPKWLEDLDSFNPEDELRKSYGAMKQINPEEFKDFDIEALIDRERKRRFNDPKYKQDYDSAESDYADEMFHASFNDSIADEEEEQRSLENDVLYDMGIDPINENVNKQKLRNLIRESLFKLLK